MEENDPMATTTLKVSGMTCQHCVRSVVQALESQDGVARADVDLTAGRARVDYDSSRITPARLANAIMDEGYEAEEIP
jgi:copper chaperone